MGEFVYVRELVIIFAIAVVVVALLARLKIPSIAAFILAGMIIGPNGLGLIDDMYQVEILAEVGVVLLLFGIGLELSLDKLKRLFRPIAFGGAVQVGLSIAATFGIARIFDIPWPSALFMGFIVAISSTAIVLRGLESRGEIDAPHGRLTLGILVFQDLCVVPMMLAIPLLSGEKTSSTDVFITLGTAALVIVGVILASRLVVPRLLRFIAATRQRHLFAMTVLLISIGTAWLTSFAGVSLALGAFLAGLVVAGSEYRHQALADLISFKDIFTSIFFVSIGMLLVPVELIDNIGPILLLLAAVLFGKFIIVLLTAWLMRLPLRVMIIAGAALAQIGEFSFLLIKSSQGTGLLDDQFSLNFIAVAILSMFLTPFFLSLGPRLAAGAVRIKAFNRLLDVTPAYDVSEGEKKWKDHIIIGGYGFAGKELARVLRECRAPYLIVELNADNIRRAKENGDPAYYGDITSPEVLERIGIEDALELVMVINDPSAVERAVRAAREITPKLHITVRTRYILDVDPLKKAGATEVIPAEMEAAVEVANRVLNRCRLVDRVSKERIEEIRKQPDEPI